MKNLTLILLALTLGSAGLHAQDRPEITFTDTLQNSGAVPQGIPVTYTFNFTNTGTSALIITNVEIICGCTSPDWSKNPIMPGQSGFVSAKFNAHQLGYFKKWVTVVSNATKTKQKLYFTGEVTPNVQPSPTDSVMKVTPNQ